MTIRLFSSNVGARRARTITHTLNNNRPPNGFYLLLTNHRINRQSMRLNTLRVRMRPSRTFNFKRNNTNIRNIIRRITRSTTRIRLTRLRPSQSINVSLRQGIPTLHRKSLTIRSNVHRNITHLSHGIRNIRINIRLIGMNPSTFRVPLHHRSLRNLSITTMVIPPTPRLTMRIVRLFMVHLSGLPLMNFSTIVRGP